MSGIGGTGGTGGGGDGTNNSSTGEIGDTNTGGGGGGGGLADGGVRGNGGNGGSGIVIISYAGPQKWTGGTYSSSGGNSIHTYTGEGTFTIIANNTSFVIN